MNVYDHIEPDLINARTSGMEQDVLISIAISLKRIADVMTKKISMPELTPEELKAMEEQYNKGGSAFGISFKG